MSEDPKSIIAVGAAMPSLGIVAVALRFYSRRQMKSPLQIDDWILIPALILTIGMGASLIAGVRLHALGYPTPFTGDLNDPMARLTQKNAAITITSKIEWALQLMQMIQLGCIKLSFVFFYRRIFLSRVSTTFNILTWIVIAIIAAWMTAFFFALLLACKAYSGQWSAWWGSVIDLSTKCVQTEKLETGLVVSDFLTDMIIILMPIPNIWALHMPTSRKLAVTAVFALGIVAVAASVVRMKYFLDVIRLGFDPNDDEDLAITRNLYWCMVESGLGLLAVCLPTLRSLFIPQNQGWLTSVRSVFSLLSQRSQRSQSSGVETRKYARGADDEYVHLAGDGVSVGRSEAYGMQERKQTVDSPRALYKEGAFQQV